MCEATNLLNAMADHWLMSIFVMMFLCGIARITALAIIGGIAAARGKLR